MTDPADEARSARLQARAEQARYTAALTPAAEELSARLGTEVTTDDAVMLEIVAAAQATAAAQDQFHLVWHRVWGRQLRAEFLATARRLAERVGDERAVLVWGQAPAVGFDVPLAPALHALAPCVGPPEGERGSRSPTLEWPVLLAAPQGQAGLRLGYEHLAWADQYELMSWGRWAISTES